MRYAILKHWTCSNPPRQDTHSDFQLGLNSLPFSATVAAKVTLHSTTIFT